MGADAAEILAEEQAWRLRAAVAAFAAGSLTLLGGILAALAYKDLPDVQLVGALREHLTPLPGEHGPGLKARQALFYDHHSAKLIGVALLLAVGVAAIGFALVYLYRATKARRVEIPRAVVAAAIAGTVTVAVAGLAQAVGVSVKASSFAGSQDQSAHAARDVLQAPVVVAALILRQVGVFALGFAFIMLALNAMRAGLLTRFMGVLGIIVGVLFIIPLGSSLPIVQAFWLMALGVLFLHRWPNGMPPAWTTGEARPWPSQQELREARAAKTADAPEKPARSDGGRPEAPAPVKPAHSSSKKRRRKRR